MTPLLSLLAPLIESLVDRIPDAGERDRLRAQAQSELRAALIAADAGQVSINAVEAGHASLFVAGWRPFVGWICGLGLAWSFLGHPIAQWAVAIWAPHITLPDIVSDHLMELVFAMLGMGGLRSFERLRGVARARLTG